MSNYKRNILLKVLANVFLFQLIFLFTSCSQTKKYIKSVDYNFRSDSSKPDYSDINNWAAHPYKYDPSDNIPADLKNERQDSMADVFFIYPTTYTDEKLPMGWNADINNKELNRKTDKSTILYQASVFNKYCRVFSPRYRQANLLAFFTNDIQKEKLRLILLMKM